MEGAGDSRMAVPPVWLQAQPGGWLLRVQVQPAARRTAVVGTHGDALKITVTAAPQDGSANRALLDFLADLLKVRRAELTLVSGHSSRSKRVRLARPLRLDLIVSALQK